ncbi:cytidylate kinase family protein [Candidatus Roizmanbacteria bacterium]|nr:cytidylate kinase family protein [Candidatus Roizmanbacteria bacterium]
MKLKYDNITISGKFAVGTTTLAKHLQEILGWKHINAGEIQRQFDRKHGIHENKQGALARPDQHEREIEAMTKKLLESKKNLIYEAWLAGFVAHGMKNILKVLLICSNDAVRVDRVVNRENISIEEAKKWIKQRESENETKWKKLYGDYNFWDKKYYNLIIDTYSSGPLETVGKVLDKLGFKGALNSETR